MNDLRQTLCFALAAILVSGLAACSDDSTSGGDTGTDGGGDMGGDTGGDMGGDTTPDVEADVEADTGDTIPPVISDAGIVENTTNILSAFIALDTDEAARAWAVADDGDGHVVTTPATDLGLTHEIFLVGLHAETAYDVTLHATDGSGNESTDASLFFETDELPEDIPPMEMLANESDEDFVVMFSVFRWTPGLDNDWTLFMAVDQDGEVVWYHRVDARGDDFRRLESGNFVHLYADESATEIDLMGQAQWDWNAADLTPAQDSLHHEVFPLPNGNYLALGTEVRNIAGYPDPESEGTVAYDVVGDVMVEFGSDGTVANTESLLDLLEDDQLRIRPGFFAPFWDNRYAEAAPNGTKDWSHGNAVIYDADTNLVMVSARTLNWIVAYDYTTGELAWRLGCEGDFELTNGTGEGCEPEWQYNQHAPEVQDDGSLLIYDNGNTRPGTGGETGNPPFSRVVRLSYDDSAEDSADWTATVEWEWVLDDDVNFTPIIGDADRLPNDNIQIVYGGLVDDANGGVFAPENRKSARIIEVTEEDEPEVVWDLEIRDPTPDPVEEDDPQPFGYHVYRAERMPSLYLIED